jgi:hypothetical protein
MKRITASKKAIVIASVALLTIAVAGGLFWYVHARTPAETPGSPYLSTCSTYTGTYDLWGTDGIKAVADEYSKAIVIATVNNRKALGESVRYDDPAPRITVTQVIKGADRLHKGDTIPVCPGLGYVKLPQGEHPTVLVFLDGKDGNTWVPTFGRIGIVPEGTRGRFNVSAISSNPKTVTADELREIIK